VIHAYYAATSYSDANVGKLLNALDTYGLRENTIVLLSGDHGWHLGEKQHWRKFALWEEATRTPFFVSVPGMTKSNSKCDQPVTLLDIYPTLAELCGLKPVDKLDGESLVPLLKDPNGCRKRPALTIQVAIFRIIVQADHIRVEFQRNRSGFR